MQTSLCSHRSDERGAKERAATTKALEVREVTDPVPVAEQQCPQWAERLPPSNFTEAAASREPGLDRPVFQWPDFHWPCEFPVLRVHPEPFHLPHLIKEAVSTMVLCLKHTAVGSDVGSDPRFASWFWTTFLTSPKPSFQTGGIINILWELNKNVWKPTGT